MRRKISQCEGMQELPHIPWDQLHLQCLHEHRTLFRSHTSQVLPTDPLHLLQVFLFLQFLRSQLLCQTHLDRQDMSKNISSCQEIYVTQRIVELVQLGNETHTHEIVWHLLSTENKLSSHQFQRRQSFEEKQLLSVSTKQEEVHQAAPSHLQFQASTSKNTLKTHLAQHSL